MTLNEMLQNAVEAEKNGVPVNWRDVAFQVYNVATNHIAQLEGDQDESPTEGE